MKNFNVYHHVKLNKYVAVKNGYSWTGFIFGLLWCLWNQLWKYAATYIAFAVVMTVLDTYYFVPYSMEVISNIISLMVGIFVGAKGNEWKAERFIDSGYDLVGLDIQAKNKSDAISKVGEN